jgi:hypothetical protein
MPAAWQERVSALLAAGTEALDRPRLLVTSQVHSQRYFTLCAVPGGRVPDADPSSAALPRRGPGARKLEDPAVVRVQQLADVSLDVLLPRILVCVKRRFRRIRGGLALSSDMNLSVDRGGKEVGLTGYRSRTRCSEPSRRAGHRSVALPAGSNLRSRQRRHPDVSARRQRMRGRGLVVAAGPRLS